MDIKNIGEFTSFCQYRGEDEYLPQQVEYATTLADYAETADKQYGGHGRAMEEWIDFAFEKIEPRPDAETLQLTRTVLTRFWKHGESFDKWFSSKVIVINAQGQLQE